MIIIKDPTLLTFLAVVNLIAIAMTIITWRRNDWGRLLFALNFLGAAAFNWIFLVMDPEEYIYYVEFVLLDSYRDFILGPFSENTRFFLGIITAAQILIGLGLLSRGRRLKVAALGAMIFLIAIAPLGLGAAFPATLIQSIGLFFIFRRGSSYTLLEWWRSRGGSAGLS